VVREETPSLDDYAEWLSTDCLVSGHLQGLSGICFYTNAGLLQSRRVQSCYRETASMRGCTTVLTFIGSLGFLQQVDGNAVHGKLLQAMAYGLPVSLD
jgi:hypothetical protein